MAKKEKEIDEAREFMRSYGYQSINEFVEKFSRGLYVYMCSNWPNPSPDILHHPEDLASNALCYAEAVHTTIQTFGAGNTNVKEQ